MVTKAEAIKLMNFEDFSQVKSVVEDFVNKKIATPRVAKKVLVVGDVGLDKYLFGDVDRISPEAPVPIVNLRSAENKLGLAANVAKNLSSLGGGCDLIGLKGDDQAGADVEEILSRMPGLNSMLVSSKTRPTTEKTRVLSGQHHLIRLDSESKAALSKEDQDSLLAFAEGLDFSKYSHVILEDYGKGVLFESFCQLIIKKAHKENVAVLVDPSKKAPLAKFRGADFFKPNYSETLSYADMAGTEDYVELLDWVRKEGEFGSLVSTLGAEGMSLCNDSGVLRVPTFARKVFDVTGAGDTVIAALAYGLSGGLTEVQACLFANFAAGYVVGKVGAVPCTLENIKSHMERFSTTEFSLKFQENI